MNIFLTVVLVILACSVAALVGFVISGFLSIPLFLKLPNWLQSTLVMLTTRIQRTDKEWDEYLNWLLDNKEIEVGRHTSKVGKYEVWTSNFPYAFGEAYRPHKSDLPRRKTALRLYKIVQQKKPKEVKPDYEKY